MKKDISHVCKILGVPRPRYQGKTRTFFMSVPDLSESDAFTLKATLEYYYQSRKL